MPFFTSSLDLFASNALKSSSNLIHINFNDVILISKDSIFKIYPCQIYVYKVPVNLSLFADGKIYNWESTISDMLNLVFKRGNTPHLYDGENKEIPSCIPQGQLSTLIPPDSPYWPILRIYAEDPSPDVYAWHVYYAVLLRDAEDFLAWIRYSRESENSGGHTARNFVSNASMHLASRNIMLHDAVGNFSLDAANVFRTAFSNVGCHAHDISPEYAGRVSSPLELRTMSKDDFFFYNYSIFDDFFPWCRYL